MTDKSALVLGAGGFIGAHLVKRLKVEGFWVRGADLKFPEFSETAADDFVIVDLREPENCRDVFDRRFDEVYQLAADMGGAGYIFTGRKMRKKKLGIKHIPGPIGVRGRNSHNEGWKSNQPLKTGLEETYRWIHDQVQRCRNSNLRQATEYTIGIPVPLGQHAG